MITTTSFKPASKPQFKYVKDLATARPAWQNVLDGDVLEIILIILETEADDNPRGVTTREASLAIGALLTVKPTPVTKSTPTSESLGALLVKLPVSRYALPRKADGVWDFFEVVERKDGRRFLNRLLGAPGSWHREFMPANLQAAAARAIVTDPKAAAIAYAQRHGRCAVCDAHLSDPASIARSMGPVCAKRF